MSLLRPLWRGLRIAEHLATGMVIVAAAALGRGLGFRAAWLGPLVPWWYRRFCRCLGMRVRGDGVLARPSLLVANHVSWLDIPVLGTQGEMGFLSKAEVRAWPLIGWMSEIVGTLFINRGANQIGEAIGHICLRVRGNKPVLVFPEGTTSDGRQVYRFHPRLFAICQQAGVQVQPVALRYGTGPEPDPIAPFVGEDTLLRHLWRVLCHPGIEVRVGLLTPIPVGDLDRRQLAKEARQAIVVRLGLDPADPGERPTIPNRAPARARNGRDGA
jgi:lyso-ornithine lipid O-acyltransferase